MAVDERARHELYRRLREVLGDREAATLMERLPAEGYADLATKQDVLATKQELRAEIQAAKQELRAEIHRVARQQTVVFTTIMAVLNGVVFTALSLA